MLRLLPLLVITALLLAGCNKQADPQTVTRLFWEAVIKNDLETMKALATAESAERLKALHNNDQQLKSIEVGEVRIDGKRAQVNTTLHGAATDGTMTTFNTRTLLVKHGDIWEVDGNETVNALMAEAVDSMISNLEKNIGDLGRQLSGALSKGIQDFSTEMNKSLPEINNQLKQLQESEKFKELGAQLGKAITDGLEQFSTELERGLEDLARELEEATEQPEASPIEQKI